MTGDRQKRAEAIFLELAAMDRRGRTAVLEAFCGEDAELRKEVSSLLAHLEAPEGFLDPEELRSEVDGSLSVRSRVGDYTILGVLGSGGMGVVYVAEQERPRRTVALKVIRRGLSSPALLRRFEHEAEVLGRLQHPGIAQIYEAGTADAGHGEQPYIAMELVKGSPLTEHASLHRLDARAKLALMAKICDAVRHAHQRGVIHRDLKPANILVDEHGQPKVLDFGVARASDADLRCTTMRTSVGQLIGTLAYMSPEQVAGDPSDVDVRSDVYALGVVMYEMLAGRLPLDVAGKSLAEAARIVRDEEPARLGAVDRALRGEVETIVAKALEKDRARRYQSAAELGEDIERFLSGRPVAAKDDSALYVLRKQLRRYQGAVAAASVFAIGLSAFSVYAYVQAERERDARELADEARQTAELATRRADEATRRVAAELSASNIERGRLLGVAGNLRAAEDLIWREHLREPGSAPSRWALWELYRREPCLRTANAHEAQIRSVACTPDGAAIATSGADGRVRLWEAASGRMLLDVAAHQGDATRVVVSPGGGAMVSCGADGAVRVWDLATGAAVREIVSGGPAVAAMDISPDGGLLAWGAGGGEVRVIGLSGDEAGERRLELGRTVRAVRFGPDGRTLAAGGDDGTMRVWDLESGAEAAPFRPYGGAVLALAFSPDGAMLASGGSDERLRLWDARTGERTADLATDNGRCRALAFSPDGRMLAAAGWWRADLWDVAARQRVAGATRPHDSVDVAFSADGRTLIVGADQGTLRIYELEPAVKAEVRAHEGIIASLAVSADGSRLLTGGVDGNVVLWDAASLSPLGRIATGTQVRAVAFGAAEGTVISAATDGLIRVWDLAAGRELSRLEGHTATVNDLAISPDGRMLVSGSLDQAVRIWDLASGECTAVLDGRHNEVLGVALSGDGSRIASAHRDRHVRVWEVATGSVVAELTAASAVWCPSFSPDGRFVSAGAWTQTVDVWEVATGERVMQGRGHTQLVPGTCFGPDGSMVASAGLDGTLKLWERATGACLATLGGRQGGAVRVRFVPGRNALAAVYRDGTLEIWDLSYFDRHIAGNAEHQAGRLAPEDPAARERLMRWVESVLRSRSAAASAGRSRAQRFGIGAAAARYSAAFSGLPQAS